MDKNSIIQRLFELGHFHNPAHMTDITKADLPNLKLHDGPVRTAIASYQEFMAADFDTLSLEEHGRIGIADGDIGPATEKLFEIQRCGYPDYTVEEAGGKGSWPSGCHPEWPANHSFAIYVDRASMPAHWNAIWAETFALVQQAYANMGIVFFETTNKKKANTVVSWQRSRTWIGLAIVPNSPRCGEQIWSKFDNAYGSSYARQKAIDQIARLKAHEWCHNMGLSHTRGGIMNPSIVSGPFTPTAWRGDPSESALKRFFGGVPVDLGGPDPKPEPDPDPNPKPPPGPNEYWFKGDFQLMRGDESLGSYILTPKPEV